MNILQKKHRQTVKSTFKPEVVKPALATEVVTESASLDGKPFQLLSNPRADGRELACACWKLMKTRIDSGFHPYLLILIASPLYLESEVTPILRAGVEAQFTEFGYAGLPMIVSSFSDNVFGTHQKNTGAVLICVASRSAKNAPTDCSTSAKSDWLESTMLGLPS